VEVTIDSLYQRYKEMEIEELIELSTRNTLTEEASQVLEQVLSERNVTEDTILELKEEIKQAEGEIFPLASLGDRFIAQILDGIVAFVILIIPIAVFGGSSDFGGMAALVAYILYLLLQDALPNGQSIGKRFTKIAVINKTSKKPCSIFRSINRNAFLVFLGFIDILFLGTRYRQRLGDMVADTIVVRMDGVVSESRNT
jgi:uncharacterized RDD family membrane protein YckC